MTIGPDRGGKAVGFRVKSGFAIAVLLEGTAAAPKPIGRGVVWLSDPEVPETRQPHHDGFGVEMADRREIARRIRIIERCARKSVGALLADRRPARAAIVVGSVIDPETVGNPHIRAHAHEGRLFRTVLEDALRGLGIGWEVIVEKQLAGRAASALRRTESEIKAAMAAFGETLGRPWRTDEKAAATAAWMMLCSRAISPTSTTPASASSRRVPRPR
jgi:hypothetical protein